MTARALMGHRLTVEPYLGSAGAALTVLLFISLGVLFSFDGVRQVWPWVLALIGARLLGKGLGVALLARPSGLGWRQALGLTLALQPMGSLAVLLVADNFRWAAQLPGFDAGVHAGAAGGRHADAAERPAVAATWRCAAWPANAARRLPPCRLKPSPCPSR